MGPRLSGARKPRSTLTPVPGAIQAPPQNCGNDEGSRHGYIKARLGRDQPSEAFAGL